MPNHYARRRGSVRMSRPLFNSAVLSGVNQPKKPCAHAYYTTNGMTQLGPSFDVQTIIASLCRPLNLVGHVVALTLKILQPAFSGRATDETRTYDPRARGELGAALGGLNAIVPRIDAELSGRSASSAKRKPRRRTCAMTNSGALWALFRKLFKIQ